MMRKKLLLVANPRAGQGKARGSLMRVADIFTKAGYDVTVHPTQGPLDALAMARDAAPDYDLLVCCGGDGTLSETVRGLMQARRPVPLGYLPAGTTNDFARTLGLPLGDVGAAAQRVVGGKPFACDVGSFGGEYFTYVAAFGAFTNVAYETSQEMKNALGHLAYVLEGILRLPSLKPAKMRVEYDGQALEDEFLFGHGDERFLCGRVPAAGKGGDPSGRRPF